ncbi:glyoxalase/bleomycin resistance protein/dioxygenase [Streptomyces sp. SPB78]|uniref:VOC family protein n=1 Tax=Streptomyces sp. (strain SPB78) TaxID=591157 RepID=UPI0001B55F27|nr:VOC family protein [Streptomyces sp. SPB78]EFL03294.1 glyoxalase/bleomycin resistance protein/dioxygenase [Streptomyces sp. SPB78]
MLTLGIPVIGVTDLARAVAFWTSALPLVESEEWRSESWSTLHHADGSGRALGLMLSQSPPEPRPRLHLDLFTETPEEQSTEVARLLALGARRVDWPLYPENPDFVVLADPDDNLFSVVDLSRAPSGS